MWQFDRLFHLLLLACHGPSDRRTPPDACASPRTFPPGEQFDRRFPIKESGKNSLFGQAVVVWLGLLVFAIINGYFRVRFLEPQVGSEIAHFLSTTTLCGAVFVATLLFIGNLDRNPALRELFGVGLLWSTSTVLFEVLLGIAEGRRSATELFADYDLTSGRLFAFVLLAEIAAPPLIGWLRDRAERRPKRSRPSRAR